MHYSICRLLLLLIRSYKIFIFNIYSITIVDNTFLSDILFFDTIKVMKRFFFFIFWSFGVITSAIASIKGDGNMSYRAEGIQTQSLFYRTTTIDQPLLGMKVILHEDQRLWRLTITLSETTPLRSLKQFKVYKTSVPYFAPARAIELTGAKRSLNGRDVHFDFWVNGSGPFHTLSPNDYLWVTTQVQPSMPKGALIDAEIKTLHINGIVCMVENESPKGEGIVYEFDRHVVPYYRMGFVGNWNKAYYNLVSEVVFFYMRVNRDGSLGYGWDAGKQFDEASFTAALDVVRKDRGDRPVRILLGIAHCAGELSIVTQDPTLRKRLVEDILTTIEKFNFDGVDIDWEYPNSAADWLGFEALVTALRPRLFSLGGGKMISSAMSNYKFPEAMDRFGVRPEVLKGLHQQLDMLNFMTYDAATTEGHSPMWLHHQSKDFGSRLLDLPPCKINIGMPCYTNEHHMDGRLTWKQQGFSWVVNNHERYLSSKDIFEHNGMLHSYNSLATIRSKAKDLKKGGYGIMIWGYDTDVTYAHAKSFARTLAGVFRPNDRATSIIKKKSTSSPTKKPTIKKVNPTPQRKSRL
jgi:hypothetical protein